MTLLLLRESVIAMLYNVMMWYCDRLVKLWHAFVLLALSSVFSSCL